MGYMKRLQQELDDLGLSTSQIDDYERRVCSRCIDDDALKRFVSRHGPVGCDFCGSTDEHGLSVLDLFTYVVHCLGAEWEDPINSMGWDDGYVGAATYDTDDLLSKVDEPFENPELRQLFVDSIEHLWCQRDPYGLRHDERLIFGWQAFADHVRYTGRYLFLRPAAPAEHRDEIPVSDMLDAVGQAITNVGSQVLKTLPAGSQLVRGRAHRAHERFTSAAELGPPPRGLAPSTRMSPAGIPLLYGAEDEATIHSELRNPENVAISRWSTVRDLIYLDLANLPDVPSLFDATARIGRPWLRFLHAFTVEVSKPASSHPDVDYAPTQVFTEYLRRVMRDHAGRPIEALRYRSAKNPDGICWAVFVHQGQCVDEGSTSADPVLTLIS